MFSKNPTIFHTLLYKKAGLWTKVTKKSSSPESPEPDDQESSLCCLVSGDTQRKEKMMKARRVKFDNHFDQIKDIKSGITKYPNLSKLAIILELEKIVVREKTNKDNEDSKTRGIPSDNKSKERVSEEPVSEKPISEQPESEKPKSNEPVSEKSVSEKPVFENLVSEKQESYISAIAKQIYANEDNKLIFDSEELTDKTVDEIVEVKFRLMTTDIKKDLRLFEMREFKSNNNIRHFLNQSKVLEIEQRQDPFDVFVEEAGKPDLKRLINCCCCCMVNWSTVGVFKDITNFLSPGLTSIKGVFGFLKKQVKQIFGWYPCRGVKSCVQ